MCRLALTVLRCGYLILYSSKHYAWGCLVAHIHIYMCLCVTMSVYIHRSFHGDGKQSWKTPVRVLKTLRMGRNGDWVLIAHGSEGVEKGGGLRIEPGLWWLWLIDSYTDAQIQDQVSFLFTAPGSLLGPYWKHCYSPRKWALLPDTGPPHTARANSIYLFIWTNFWPLPYWICPLNRFLPHPPIS